MSQSKGLEGVIAAETRISSIVDATLTYRGYTIEELAEKASFEEVVFLLWHGHLPNATEYASFTDKLQRYSAIPDGVRHLLRQLPKEANTMETLRTLASALPLFQQPMSDIGEEAIRMQAQIASLVAAISRHRSGLTPIEPNPNLSYAANFLYMLRGAMPDGVETDAFNKALILHADHELNASTFSSRVTVATLSDVHSGLTSAIGTLKGPLHGGANEQVMVMLSEIGSLANVETYIREKMANKEKIMGIGHRVYRNGDPRAFILKDMARKLTDMHGKSELFEMSDKIESLIEAEKGLKPNVDFYSASVYHCMGIDTALFTPIFAVSRTAGWMAHMMEQLADNRLIRPRAAYVGETHLSYVPMGNR